MNSWSIILPFPISVNSMYYNRRKGGRKKKAAYVSWIKACDKMALSQKPFFNFDKRVDITIHLNGGKSTSDCDNLSKGPVDYLVRIEVIKDDCKPYVRSTKQIWDDSIPEQMCLVFIEEC